jgi:hypothetical protein
MIISVLAYDMQGYLPVLGGRARGGEGGGSGWNFHACIQTSLPMLRDQGHQNLCSEASYGQCGRGEGQKGDPRETNP